nr:signal peptidase I [Tissierella sp.]
MINTENDENDSKKDKGKKEEMIDWIKSISFAIIVAVLINTFLFNSTYVLGNSMQPTLHPKDRLFAVKATLFFKGPERGDIVILKAPDDPKKDYIKRIIGVEGDLVEIIEGRVYVNEKLLEEDYIEQDSYTHIYNTDIWEVGEDEVFVLGDNREKNASKDSRTFGVIDVKDVKGITGFRYFPINDRFGSID